MESRNVGWDNSNQESTDVQFGDFETNQNHEGAIFHSYSLITTRVHNNVLFTTGMINHPCDEDNSLRFIFITKGSKHPQGLREFISQGES